MPHFVSENTIMFKNYAVSGTLSKLAVKMKSQAKFAYNLDCLRTLSRRTNFVRSSYGWLVILLSLFANYPNLTSLVLKSVNIELIKKISRVPSKHIIVLAI